VVASGVREAFSDLFALNTRANELSPDDVKNKLRTLFAGRKTVVVIDRIAKTFKALCEYADFSSVTQPKESPAVPPAETTSIESKSPPTKVEGLEPGLEKPKVPGKLAVTGLQYHINIALPDTRDQAVYDAIFRSLREHLG
jgi:hypothetical protein